MPASATMTSIGSGLCFGHPPTIPIPMMGTIITGSPTVKAGGLGSGFTTSIVLGYCGHVGIIIDGSATSKANSLSKARVGSNFTGIFMGVIITGMATIEVGG